MKKKVVIIGGGGGGAVLANSLPKDKFEIVVLDKSRYHIFQPGFLWIAFEGESINKFMRPIRELLKPYVNFIQKEVSKVDLNERTVETVEGEKIKYDYVVIAAGASLDYGAIPGNKDAVKEFGDFYSTPENAQKLWLTLNKVDKGNFVISVADPIYKCPPGPNKGIFLSDIFFRKKGIRDKVKLILTVPFAHSYPSKTIADEIDPVLKERDIEVRTFFTLDRIDMKRKVLRSIEGDEIEFAALAVIPIHKGPNIKIVPEKVLTDDGYIKIDKYKINIEGFDDAFAIGDCTNAPTSKAGIGAHLQADVVVERLQGFDAKFNGRTNCPLITDGKALFVISDYNTPPVKVRLSKFKRLLESLFVATYWDFVKYPEFWKPIFDSYWEATNPEKIKEEGW